ncbi:hypothetical protein [Sorangium sp. So ce1024]|uniref:hypothetical protein n=1 Tax=Sorangium sp. So ce1024 TaxID=3133327 RepID=UPI003F018ED9
MFVVEREGEPICRIEAIVVGRRTAQNLVRLLQTAPCPDGGYLDSVEKIARNQPTVPETA